jgi:hypothetical protein
LALWLFGSSHAVVFVHARFSKSVHELNEAKCVANGVIQRDGEYEHSTSQARYLKHHDKHYVQKNTISTGRNNSLCHHAKLKNAGEYELNSSKKFD